jgi:hypothetical protein
MTLQEMLIQCHFDGLTWFPEVTRDLSYNMIALGGEIGELQNKFKKVLRGDADFDFNDPRVRADLGFEATDILVYLLNIFAILNINPEATYDIVRARNIERFGQPDHAVAISNINNGRADQPPSS